MLSVVIPTFNRCDSLKRTLEGLSRQTAPRDSFEAIVVSDGSSDGTDEMVTAYARSAPFPLLLHRQNNAGPSAARNRGIRAASGEVIVFLDDDVEPAPGLLERHGEHHRHSERVAVLGTMSPDPAVRRSEPVWIAWEHAKLQEIYDMFRPGGEYSECHAGPMHFYSGNASIRRQWLLDVGGFDETFKRQEDVELAVRLERQCDVWFEFDMLAEGLHRPMRTFQSWIRIPAAYGRLDAKRVLDGALELDEVRRQASGRNAATRIISQMCQSSPPVTPVVTEALKTCALAFYRAGSRGAAFSALSALYNVTYIQQFYQALAASNCQSAHPVHL